MRKGMGMDHFEQDPFVGGQPLAEDLVALFVQQGVSYGSSLFARVSSQH
jgi:hypothetical protein